MLGYDREDMLENRERDYKKREYKSWWKKIADEQNSKHHFLDAVSSLLFSFHSFPSVTIFHRNLAHR